MVAERTSTDAALPLCACGCGLPIPAGTTWRRGHHWRKELPTLLCPECGAEFRPPPHRAETRKYCGQVCFASAARTWRAHNRLKARFLGKMQAEHLEGTGAARAADVSYDAVVGWFHAPDRRLRATQLKRIAAWLDISLEEAERLQGGSAEARQREIARTAKRVQVERLRTDPTYRQRVGIALSEAGRGRRSSAETRARQSASMKQYRARPDAHPNPAARYKQTPHGRAQTITTSLRRWHPDWPPERVEAEAVRRILTQPTTYRVKSEEAARALLAPKPKPRPIRRRAARRPHRCATLIALDAEMPRIGNKRPYGFIAAFRQRVYEVEGDDMPQDDARLWEWVRDHCQTCPRHRATPRVRRGLSP